MHNSRRRQRSAPITAEVKLHASAVRGLDGAAGARSLQSSNIFVNKLRKFNFLGAELGSACRYILCYSSSSGFSGCNAPLIDAHKVGNAILNNYVAGDWTISGLLGNASNKSTNTNWNPSTWLNAGDGHLFRWNTVNGNNAFSAIGAQDGSGHGFYLGAENTATSWWGSISSNGGEVSLTHTETLAFYIVSRIASGNIRLRRTTAQLGSASSTDSTQPNLNLYVHSKNDGTVSEINNDRTWIVGAGAGLSDAQCDALNNLVSEYKANLGA